MKNTKTDVPGVIAGTVFAGAATIWILNDKGIVQTGDLGLTAALLLVVAGIVGLGASHRN